MINSFGDQFFQRSHIFERYVNLFFFRAFFVNITNLTSTYKTYRKKSKEYSIMCKMDFYWISCDQ